MDENTIPITRPSTSISPASDALKSARSEGIPEQYLEKSKFPTEIVDLPSKGWFYPEGHPLSSGKIELKMMTAREEDILTSQNLIKKGVVLQKLVESLIIDKRIKAKDILLCDMNGIFVAIRRMAYGDKYGPLKINCNNCSFENELSIDLSKIEVKPFEFEKFPRGVNLFTFDLPYSKKQVSYKLITQGEDEVIEGEIKQMLRVNKEKSFEITTRLKHVIQSVDGSDDMSSVRKFIENELVSRDSLALRTHIRNSTPDMDMDFGFVCSECNHEERMGVPMTVQFFWPQS